MMKVVEINYSDLPGRVFNGYDLHLSLNQIGYQACQIVKDKRSNTNTVVQLERNLLLEKQIKDVEKRFSMSNILEVYGKQLQKEKEFIECDIAHYHILHNDMISLLDLPNLMKEKPSVWTIHDPWIVTGNCVHPHECGGWLQECKVCNNLNYKYFEMKQDKAHEMWQIKKEVFKDLEVDIIVASDFMKRYIEKSPITQNIKRIHKIPFGVHLDAFEKLDKKQLRKKYMIEDSEFVLGFRNEDAPIKGCKHIFDAINYLNNQYKFTIITVGSGELPEEIKAKNRCIELGWQDNDEIMREFYTVCDTFVMPSLAESFGLMAIEAMAAQTAVICFKDTVVAENTQSPQCGFAVEYASSIGIKKAIEYMLLSREECLLRGKMGREIVRKKYQYNTYVNKHIELYKDILNS